LEKGGGGGREGGAGGEPNAVEAPGGVGGYPGLYFTPPGNEMEWDTNPLRPPSGSNGSPPRAAGRESVDFSFEMLFETDQVFSQAEIEATHGEEWTTPETFPPPYGPDPGQGPTALASPAGEMHPTWASLAGSREGVVQVREAVVAGSKEACPDPEIGPVHALQRPIGVHRPPYRPLCDSGYESRSSSSMLEQDQEMFLFSES